MKKHTIITTILVCMMTFSGCSALSDLSKSQPDTTSIAEKNDKSDSEEKKLKAENAGENPENTEITANKIENQSDSDDAFEKKSEDTTQSEPETKTETKIEKNPENEFQPANVDNLSEQSEEKVEELSEDTQTYAYEQEIKTIATEQFKKSCETYWKFILGCPYEYDYNDQNGYAVRLVSVNSLSDVEEAYMETFTQVCPELYEKYFEIDGKVYGFDGGRGGNIYYQDTDLELISYEGDTAVFNAVSHYADEMTGEVLEDEINTFTIVCCDGVWKTSEFKIPY